MFAELTIDELQALEDLTPLSAKELGMAFEERAAIAISQPDDKLALQSLSSIITESHRRGDIEQTMRMAMEIGALACLHPHLEDTANQAGNLTGKPIDKDGHQHDNRNDPPKHEAKTCKQCKAGYYCAKAGKR